MNKRQTIECFNALALLDRVSCRKGKPLSNHKDSTLSFKQVCRGVTAKVCLTCEYYDDKDEVTK